MTANNISVIGVGRLGLCACLSFEAAGYNVLGCDINAPYVEQLNNKTFRSPEPGVTAALASATQFRATCDLAATLAHSDLVFVFVDTPSGGANGSPYDTSKLSTVLQLIAKSAVEKKHVMIGCTVLPGYTAKIGKYLLQDKPNVTLNYNPEFIAQGDIMRGFVNPDMVLIGEESKEAGDLIEAVYRKTCKNEPSYRRMSPASAEITKLALNCYVTMKIAYANAIGDLANDTEGANAKEILAAVGSDSRIGNKYLRPGYGYGGPCFPRDNRALGTYAETVGHDLLLAKATDEANERHRGRQVADLLKKHPEDHHFVFKSVTYKPDCPVPIIEQSQKLMVAAELAEAGRRVTVIDRREVLDAVKRDYGGLFEYEELSDN